MTLQRNAKLRTKWKLCLTEWKSEQLMFLNKFVVNEKTSDQKYEWVSIEAIINSHELLKYIEKWSIFSLYMTNK